MIDPIHILAQDDDSGNLVKVIFGVIVFVFWAISAIATWLNKKHEEARRQRLRDQLNQGAPEPRPSALRPVAVRMPPPPPRAPAPHKRFPQRAPKPPRQPARSRAVVTPPPMPVVAAEVTDATTLPVTATDIARTASSRAAQSPAASAASIARWLRPDTLRQQFILTEILQPPLALREAKE